MLALIAGGDAKMRAEKRKKITSQPLEELSAAALGGEELATIAGTPTFLGEPRAFFLRNVLNVKNEQAKERTSLFRDDIVTLAQELVQSPHLFIFEEEKAPLTSVLEKLTKAGAKIDTLSVPIKKQEFNAFALADALGEGNRKQLWLLLVRALRSGASPEQLCGMLAWKARTMLIASKGAQRNAMREVSKELVVMYHDSHRGAGDLSLLLERFALRQHS